MEFQWKNSRIVKYVLVYGLAIVFMAIVMLFLSTNAQAVVIVDQAGGGDYLTIQEGVNNAIPGETVYVWDGTYNENITIDKPVVIIGNSSATTTLDATGLGNNAANITAEGVEITGLSIINDGLYYGIHITAGGFYIHDNELTCQGGGINVDLMDMGRDLSGVAFVSIGDMTIDSNNITAGKDGISINLENIGFNLSDDTQVQLGALNVIWNTIDAYRGINISRIMYLGYDLDGFAQFTWGGLYVDDNVINVTNDGIFQDQGAWPNFNMLGYWGYDMNDSASFTMGDVSFSRNDITAGNWGIWMEWLNYWGNYMNGSSSFTMGSVLFNDNVINATFSGIVLNELSNFGNYMNDDSTFEMGEISFDRNRINATGWIGMELDGFSYWGCYMSGSSSFRMGNVTFNDNNITAGAGGIEHYGMERHGNYMYDNSTYIMGDIEFNRNWIVSGSDGTYLEDFDYWGSYMYGNAAFLMGDVEFNDNTINAGADGLAQNEQERHGYDMHDNTSFIMGNLEFCRNNIQAGYGGMALYHFARWGYQMDGICSVTIGDFLLNDNQITAVWSGIYLADNCQQWGSEIYTNSSVTIGMLEIFNNTIDSDRAGINITLRNVGRIVTGDSTVDVGAFRILENTLTGFRGIEIRELRNFGYNMSGNAMFTWGGLYVDENVINATQDGILQGGPWPSIDIIGYWGYWLNDSASFVMGDVSFSHNTINASNDGIAIYRMRYLARYLNDNSNASFGHFLFKDNLIEAGNNGIYVRDMSYLAHDIYGNSITTFGNFLFNNNVIVSGNYGIHTLWLEYFARYTYGNSMASFGNFEFNLNNISSTNHGIFLDDVLNDCGRNMYNYSSAIFGHLQTNHNNITSGGRGIYYDYFADTATYIHDHTYFQMDNFEICHNIIDSGDDGIYANSIYDLAYFMYNDSIAVFGDFLFTDNIINANGDGIYVNNFWYIGRYLYSNASAFIGNVGITNNEITAGGQGIYFRYQHCGSQLHGNSTATFGITQFNDNNITAGLNGTYFFAQYLGHEMYNGSSFEMGNIEICANTINASGDGIRIYRIVDVAYDLNDYANASFGDFLFNDNTIVAGNYGIYNGDFEYIARTMYGYSMATFGNFEFNLNNISSTNHGIYLDDTLNDCGNNMYDYSSAIFGHLQVNHNNITSGGYGIYYDYFADNGAYNRDHSYFQWDNFEIRHNIIDSGDDGIYIFSIYDLGYQLNNDSIAVFGDFLFTDNIIKSNGDGIYINNFHFIGRYLRSNASAYFGNIEINNNEINANGEGLHLRCRYFLAELYGNASVVFGQIQMNANNITSGMNAINFSALYYGQRTHDNCTAYAGIIQIDGNDMIAGEKGIYIYFFNVYYEIFNNSYLSFEDIMISNNVISALTIGIDIQYEECGDLYHTSTANLPGLQVFGNWVEATISAFNYTTIKTPSHNDPGATQVWGDVILDGNDFDAGLFGVVFDWQDPNASAAQPMFFISNTNIHDGSAGSIGLLLINITSAYGEMVTIDTVDYGIFTNNSAIHYMINSTLVNCAFMDISLYSDSYLFMVNSTFDNSSVFFEDFDSLLEVGWFMNVLVQSQVPLPIPGAIVAVADVDGTEIFNSTTNANGQAFYIICREYQENITGIIKNFNDYTANATKSGAFGVAAPNPTMNQTRLVIITLTDNVPPILFSDNSDTAGTTGDPFYFEISASDNMGINSVHVNFRFDGVGPYTNLTMTGTGPYWLTEILPTDYVGFIEYYFDAQDAGGSWVNTTPTTAPITDNDKPTINWVLQPITGTTGESVLVSVLATDNIDITYYMINIDGMLYDMVKDGDYYNFTINIPSDSIASITYSVILNDSANNPNSTMPTMITVTDNDEPTFIWNLQPTSGTTGESEQVSIIATDNIGIIYYKINVSGTLYDLIKDGDYYNYTINVPPDSTASITYNIIFNDNADNPNATTDTVLTVTDNDEPTFIWNLQPTTAMIGDSVNVSLLATDNIGITYYQIDIDGTLYDMTKDGDYYNYTIDIPTDSIADITYTVMLNDSANNPNTTAPTVITVTENEPPTYAWVSQPITGTTGESVVISLLATDNIGITYDKINIDGVLYDMVKDGDYYNYTIDIPLDSTASITYNITFNDSSNNPNITADTVITVIDDDEPIYSWILQPAAGIAGDTVLVSLMASDNIGITYYQINIDGTLYDMVMDGDYYNYTINIPPGSTASITYSITFNDSANNPNATADTVITVSLPDSEAPEISWVSQPTAGTTGESVLISVMATDNIGITYYRINIDGILYDLVKDGDYYN